MSLGFTSYQQTVRYFLVGTLLIHVGKLTLNTRTGKGLRITRPGKGGQILPLPAISASIRARITKLGKRKDTPVNFMVCNFW